MRWWRVVASVLAMSAAAACGGGGGSSATSSANTSSTAAATSVPVASTAGGTTVPPTNLTLHVTDVHLANSQDTDNALRILLPAGVASASVTLGGLPTPNQVVSVCQANDIDRVMASAACHMPANGDVVNVPLGTAASGVEISPAAASGSAAAGTETVLDVTVRYAASSRDVSARLPQIAAGGAGGKPSFALTPADPAGAYKATLTWTVIQVFGGTASTGRLEVLQGGNVTGQSEGSGLMVQLNGNLSSPGGDVAIRVQNTGSGALVSPKLTLTLP